MWGRGDVRNAPESNGEYWMLRHAIQGSPVRPLVLFDIGCLRGDWTAEALRLGREHDVALRVHAFEPEGSAYRHIVGRFAETPDVSVRNMALSDRVTTADFFVVGDMNGTNTLAFTPGATRVQVPVTTVDRYCAEHGIDRVDYVKSDAEGFDSQIIAGALGMLREGRVGVWQFEYNYRWIDPRRFLRDVFEMVAETPYSVGKLVGEQVEIFDAWHFELEKFFEGNYVLAKTAELAPGYRRGRFSGSNVYE
jgi:FkbM family methyltransferase